MKTFYTLSISILFLASSMVSYGQRRDGNDCGAKRPALRGKSNAEKSSKASERREASYNKESRRSEKADSRKESESCSKEIKSKTKSV